MTDSEQTSSAESHSDPQKVPVVTIELDPTTGEVLTPEQLNEIEPKARQAAIQLIMSRQAFSGPLPPPEILAKYDDIEPGTMNRIIAMAESQIAHSQDMDRRALSCTFRERITGQVFGLVIGLTAIIGGVVAAMNGSQVAGTIIGGLGLAGLVSVFVIGRRQDDADEDDVKDIEDEGN